MVFNGHSHWGHWWYVGMLGVSEVMLCYVMAMAKVAVTVTVRNFEVLASWWLWLLNSTLIVANDNDDNDANKPNVTVLALVLAIA